MLEVFEENEYEDIDEEIKYGKKRMIKIIILIILIIFVIITSFKSGERFFEIKNANFDESYSTVGASVAYWYFDAEIKLRD